MPVRRRAPAPLLRAAVVAAGALVLLVGDGVARGGDPKIEAPQPSFGFYLRRIAPWTDEHCASCHRSAGAGAFRLHAPVPPVDGPADIARREREFESARRLLDPESPWKSRLLLKLIGEENSGLPHAGGAFLRPDDDIYDDLLDFASGATLANLPPEPEPGRDRRAKPGDEVTLDASNSYDRDDDPLSFRWELYVRPPGSRAGLTETTEKTTRFRPDVGGTYVVRLRVFDRKMWSAPKPVVVEVLERVGPEAPDAVAASGLAGVDAAALRRVRSVYGDVLGRPPTPPEALAHLGKPAREIAEILLATVEGGRAFVEDEAYRLALVGDAEPISREVQSLPFRLSAGELSPAAAAAALVRDPAWARAHPPGAGHARAVARLLLDRDATAADLVAYADPGALAALLESREFAVAALRRLASRYLPAADAAAVPQARAGESTRALALSFVSSAAWAGSRELRRAADDLAFVRATFADLLGRRPTSGELTALARGATVIPGVGAGRAAIVSVVLDSGEVSLPLIIDIPDPSAWIADRFLRTLGRAPGEEEMSAYKTALLDPGGGPHLVMRALLTSPEYASR